MLPLDYIDGVNGARIVDQKVAPLENLNKMAYREVSHVQLCMFFQKFNPVSKLP